MTTDEALKLLAALLLGALIGLEREWHGKPAGFRTNIMICLGACLFTILSQRMAQSGADMTRIAAQVVTGVGFIGAGAIVRQRGAVLGLTTAATIWTVASVGMALGAGEFKLAFFVAALACAVLFALTSVEAVIERRRHSAVFRARLPVSQDAIAAVRGLVQQSGAQLQSFSINKISKGYVVRMLVHGHSDALTRVESALLARDDVRSLRRM